MKNWCKILVIVILGAFVFPNTAKLFHNCEKEHLCCDTSDFKNLATGYKDTVPQEAHNCYICNFHYSGFNVAEALYLSVCVNNYNTKESGENYIVYASSLYLSNQLRAPPYFV